MIELYRKIFAAVLVVLVVLGCFSACSNGGKTDETTTVSSGEQTSSSGENERVKINVGCIAGPTGVGMASLMNLGEENKTLNEYTFSVVSSPDEIVSKFANGEIDIASVPTNLAAKLNAKLGGNVRMLAINTGCVLYIAEKGETVNSVADLKGKTIWSTGEGANPEYVLRSVLSANGIDPDKDVTIRFVVENTELVAKLAGDEAEIALAPEPFLTTACAKVEGLRSALSIGDIWSDMGKNGNVYMGCVIAKADFVEKNKAAVDTFLEEYRASIEATSSDVKTVAELCEKYKIIASAAVAEKAIPKCAIVFIPGAECETALSDYFNALFELDPTSVGGAVPESGFYYAG